MMDLSVSERRRVFSTWLRTGRVPVAKAVGNVELKFNPNHDPADGRFTFAGAGGGRAQSVGGGAAARGSAHQPPATRARPKVPAARPMPPKPAARRPIPHDGWGGDGFTGGGGGSFGGAGASSTEPWGNDLPKRRQQPEATAAASARQLQAPAPQRPGVAAPAAPLHREVRNGYEYQIDDKGRTRRVTGSLTLASTQVRSRLAQAQAGGADRRPTDDGGHYIATRFNGPTDAFNHFAQDRNFNRGRYRLLEDQWARAKRAGKKVSVKIVPGFIGSSRRPAIIDITFTINGEKRSVKLANEPQGKQHGK